MRKEHFMSVFVFFFVIALIPAGCVHDPGGTKNEDNHDDARINYDANSMHPDIRFDLTEPGQDNGHWDTPDIQIDQAQPDPGIPNDPCAGISCSNHGHCKVQNGLAMCDCDAGYQQNGLDCIRIPTGKTRILFDAGHGVTSGNADWRIDDDSPKPLPARPNKETDWDGAISRWAFELYKTGEYEIYNSRRDFTITYGGAAELDLKNFTIFVSCEPNHPYSGPEKKALLNFVQNGGRFVLVIDHRRSDRDRDGWDSPMIANDLFTNNGVKNNPFGITIPGDSQNGYGENISGNMRSLNTSHPVINGPFGVVRQINFHNGSYFTIDPASGAQAIAWQGFSRSVSTVIAAVTPYGKGWFALVGDSSPVDDGTGSPHDKLYDGWGEADDGIFLMNLIDFMRTH